MASSATFNADYVYSSQQVGKPECVANQINELAPWETPLLSLIGIDSLSGILNKPLDNETYTWQDMEWTPTRTTLASAITSTTVSTFKVSDKIFKPGEEVVIDYETITLGTTSDYLTFAACYRSSGAGAGATHVSGAKVIGMGKMETQGTAAGTAIGMIQPVQRSNYTSIIMKDISTSGTSNSQKRYGRNGSEYDYQAAIKLRECFETLENRCWFGWSQAASAGTTAGGTKGIYEFVQGVNSANLSSLNPTFEDFEGYIDTINDYDNTASDLYAFLPLYTRRVINSWGAGKIQHDVDLGALPRMAFGQAVDVLFVGDRRIIIVPYRKFRSTGFIINPNKIGVGPLNDRAFSHTYKGADGDRTSGWIVGEYGLALSNPRAHYFLYGLKAS
jgi:hypothetical protein